MAIVNISDFSDDLRLFLEDLRPFSDCLQPFLQRLKLVSKGRLEISKGYLKIVRPYVFRNIIHSISTFEAIYPKPWRMPPEAKVENDSQEKTNQIFLPPPRL